MPTSVLRRAPELRAPVAFPYDREQQAVSATPSRLNWNTSRYAPQQFSRDGFLPSFKPMTVTPPIDPLPNDDTFTRPRMPALKRPKVEDDETNWYGAEPAVFRSDRNRNLSIGELSNSSDTQYSQKPDLIAVGGSEMRDPSQRTPGNNSSSPGPGPGCTRCSALEPLMQDAARSLTKLRSGLEQPQLDQLGALNDQQCPQVSELGLVHTLQWMLDALEDTHLFVSQAVASRSTLVKNETRQSTACDPDHNENMKRHMPSTHDGEYKRQLQETNFRPELRRSSTTGLLRDELPPISSRSPFPNIPIQSSFVPRTGASMDPPPPLGSRQLPSPPSRSQQSPPRYALSSPSSTFRSGALPPPTAPTSNVHQPHPPSINTVLQPISPTSSVGSVAHAHSAALQHEISLRTLQLQSLQSEHENLLAAYTRSENRASDLERKHALTDAELAGLQEERMQLQTKILELEQNVDELSKSRSQARQAAVQEGAQYVKIVKMASRLEEMAAKERKSWNDAREELERRIEDLRNERDAAMAQSSGRPSSQTTGTTSPEAWASDEPSVIQDLRMEVARLKRRCHGFETALISVRSDSRLLENGLDSLAEARKRIFERVDQTLDTTEASKNSPDTS